MHLMFPHECLQITFNKKDQDVVTFIFKAKDGGKPKGYIYIIEKDQLKAAVECIQGNLRRLKGEKAGQEDGDGTNAGKSEAVAEGAVPSARGSDTRSNGAEDAKPKAALEALVQQEEQKPAHRSAQDASKASELSQHERKPTVQQSGAVNANSNKKEQVYTDKQQASSAQSEKIRNEDDNSDSGWLQESPSPAPTDKRSQAEEAATQSVGSAESARDTQRVSDEKDHDETKQPKQTSEVGVTKAALLETESAKDGETTIAGENIVFNEDTTQSLMDDDDLDWLADVPADTG